MSLTDIWLRVFDKKFHFTLSNISLFLWLHSRFSHSVCFSATVGKFCGYIFCLFGFFVITFPMLGFLSFFNLVFQIFHSSWKILIHCVFQYFFLPFHCFLSVTAIIDILNCLIWDSVVFCLPLFFVCFCL